MASVTVLVCRDSCCGRAKKHPGTDHAAQLAAIDDACESATNARVIVTRCLDVCVLSNVVVVRHHIPGAPTIWLGKVLSSFHTRLLTEWLRAGGPATTPLPKPLRALVFEPAVTSTCAADAHLKAP